ncbi:hypothetical protein NFI96_005866 [Prochilodus magdalenae]|nr:hypothetical protein NFI96_005866 [Prochilodus magdalenae]
MLLPRATYKVVRFTENPVSVELSCGVGPVRVILEPPDPVLLDCHLGAAEAPLNITWLRDGAVLSESEAIQLLHNGSLLVLPSSREVEGAYSCLSGSSFGALTSRTVTLQLAMPAPLADGCTTQDYILGGLHWQRVIFSDESHFGLGGDDLRIRVWRHRGQHQDERFDITRPEGLVSLHLHPYRTICRNCVRIFKLHGMDYPRTPLGTSV